jgi:carbon-monoxide dehydrogenase medium subunit
LRGTFCGSLAHADPASEWCLAAVTLGADLELSSKNGTRRLQADAFLHGLMTTALAPDEIVVAAHVPLLPDSARTGFYEFSRRPGDFAVAMALAVIELRKGEITNARLGIGAVEGKPRRLEAVEAFIVGRKPDLALFEEAGRRAAAAVDPMADPVNPAEYRRTLACTVVTRALEKTLT